MAKRSCISATAEHVFTILTLSIRMPTSWLMDAAAGDELVWRNFKLRSDDVRWMIFVDARGGPRPLRFSSQLSSAAAADDR